MKLTAHSCLIYYTWGDSSASFLFWTTFFLLNWFALHTFASDSKKTRKQLFEAATNGKNGVLLTTYDRMRISQSEFLKYNWGYVILDEGHKIRNPDAEITLACKQVIREL